MITYLVIWTEISNYYDLFSEQHPRMEVDSDELHEDHWQAVDDFKSAEMLYDDLISEGDQIVSCSIVVPVRSTDYEEVSINV